jgi:hypothetical protein
MVVEGDLVGLQAQKLLQCRYNLQDERLQEEDSRGEAAEQEADPLVGRTRSAAHRRGQASAQRMVIYGRECMGESRFKPRAERRCSRCVEAGKPTVWRCRERRAPLRL